MGEGNTERLLVELARAGLIRNEAWIKDHCEAAAALYADDATAIGGMVLAASHPYALDYLKQAPVLVLGPFDGGTPRKKDNRFEAVNRFRNIVGNGLRLRPMMKWFHLGYQLRGIDGYAVRWDFRHALRALGKLHPSTLAQIIPADRVMQALWLRVLDAWQRQMARRHARTLGFAWAAPAFSKRNFDGTDPSDLRASDLADFYGEQQHTFNHRWTLAQACDAMERWHAELARDLSAADFEKRYGVAFDAAVDYGALPTDITINGFQFVALRSGADLHTEGKAMHHCVASYARELIDQGDRFYSIRRGDHRLATLQIVFMGSCLAEWTVRQLRGPCNGPFGGNGRGYEAISQFLNRINAAEEIRQVAA